MSDNDRQLIHQDHQVSGVHFPLTLLLDDVTDPANVGAIFRLADALGVERLILGGETVKPPNRRLSRTSRSTDRAVAYDVSADINSCVVGLRKQGYQLIALELSAQSVDLQSLDYGAMERICLILGAEQTGVRSSLLEIVDYSVHISMLGVNSSMNVATAGAIAVYEMTRYLHGAVGTPDLIKRIEGESRNEKT